MCHRRAVAAMSLIVVAIHLSTLDTCLMVVAVLSCHMMPDSRKSKETDIESAETHLAVSLFSAPRLAWG